MATKITETIEREVYVWKCPECGKETKSQIEMYVDKPCVDCTHKADAEKFRTGTKHLIGARIIDVDGEYYSSSVMPLCNIDSIIVATQDGVQFVISGEEYAEGDPDLVINEVKHPIKVDRGDIIKRGD